MAGALMRGMMRGNLGVRDIVAYDLCGEKVLALGVAQAHSVEEAARLAPILVVAVKPQGRRGRAAAASGCGLSGRARFHCRGLDAGKARRVFSGTRRRADDAQHARAGRRGHDCHSRKPYRACGRAGKADVHAGFLRPRHAGTGSADGCGRRHQRFRPRLSLHVSGGVCRCGRAAGAAARARLYAGRADHAGRRQDGAGDRHASRAR